jgi:L-fuconolactonase
MPVIDSHHHLWKYSAAEYGWMNDRMQAIRRDFLPADLEKEIRGAGVDGVVTVQARQTLEETEWLLSLAARHPFQRGVVGWVPLIDPKAGDILGPLAQRPALKAVRHVLHDEADPMYMLRDDFNRGIRSLANFHLVYDILIFESHLPQTLRFVDKHPNQVFVVDHIAKPRIAAGEAEPWRTHIRELAKRPHIYCKVSGMVTEADWSRWTEAGLKPYFETVLETFGPARLMFGSDWPVSLVACQYRRWFDIVKGWTARLSEAERSRILGGTAIEAYKL